MSQKLDVMDFLIQFIVEHEKKLDDLSNRLEEVVLFLEKGPQS